MTDRIERIRGEVACRDCESEVRVTVGTDCYRPYRARVIHTADCPWLPRYLAHELSTRNGDYVGAIPCSTVVTHRGPYKRDPDRRTAS